MDSEEDCQVYLLISVALAVICIFLSISIFGVYYHMKKQLDHLVRIHNFGGNDNRMTTGLT